MTGACVVGDTVVGGDVIGGAVVGGGAVVRKTRDPGYTLMVVPDGQQTLFVHSFSGRF